MLFGPTHFLPSIRMLFMVLVLHGSHGIGRCNGSLGGIGSGIPRQSKTLHRSVLPAVVFIVDYAIFYE